MIKFVVPKTGVELEYEAMAHNAYEIVWVQSLLCEITEMGVVYAKNVFVMLQDNQVAIMFANNLIFHERTKPMDAGCQSDP